MTTQDILNILNSAPVFGLLFAIVMALLIIAAKIDIRKKSSRSSKSK